jgi:hypothetical protein
MALEEEIQGFEEQLLQPETRASSESLSWMLADDFVGIGSTGQTFDKQNVVDRLPSETPNQWTIDQFQIRQLCSNLVLATYLVVRHSQPGRDAFAAQLNMDV